MGKVRARQHLLTHSFSAKTLAVRRVTENQGKRTPGVDRVTWRHRHRKQRPLARRQRGYRPQPLRRVYIAKSNGKLRGLALQRHLSALPKFAPVKWRLCSCQ